MEFTSSNFTHWLDQFNSSTSSPEITVGKDRSAAMLLSLQRIKDVSIPSNQTPSTYIYAFISTGFLGKSFRPEEPQVVASFNTYKYGILTTLKHP
ncbi:hypothetical protein RUM44_004702 [Polyplax serrata]|uniref:Uncharacterized protein n=1 Tax=Polyplax serrata TaxID=468196 RepID=A0ABR1B3L6_POLSC